MFVFLKQMLQPYSTKVNPKSEKDTVTLKMFCRVALTFNPNPNPIPSIPSIVTLVPPDADTMIPYHLIVTVTLYQYTVTLYFEP